VDVHRTEGRVVNSRMTMTSCGYRYVCGEEEDIEGLGVSIIDSRPKFKLHSDSF
jgi:hypothetical protein